MIYQENILHLAEELAEEEEELPNEPFASAFRGLEK
jgi:hypothetical protein